MVRSQMCQPEFAPCSERERRRQRVQGMEGRERERAREGETAVFVVTKYGDALTRF